MKDETGAGRRRAEEQIRKRGREIAIARTLGWGGPIERVAGRYPFIVEHVRPLRSSIPAQLPVLIFQSREKPPERMEVAVPYVNPMGSLSARVIPSHPSTQEHAQLLGDFASALWFAIAQRIVPEPRDSRPLEKALTRLVGPNLIGVSID